MKLHRRNFLRVTAGAAALSALPNVSRAQGITKDLVADFGAVGDGVADDAPAFRAFNDWARADQHLHPEGITLTLPAGTFQINSADSAMAAHGIPVGWNMRANCPVYNVHVPITVQGAGRDLTIIRANITRQDDFWGPGTSARGGIDLVPGAFAIINGADIPGYAARLREVRRGDRHLRLKDPSAARFFVPTGPDTILNTRAGLPRMLGPGEWACVAGLDLQRNGWPPNNHFFEYVRITHVDQQAGVITIADEIEEEIYKETWVGRTVEEINDPAIGGGLWTAGPVTLYALSQVWDADVTYRDLAYDMEDGSAYGGRSLKFINFKQLPRPPLWLHHMPSVSCCKYFEMTGSDIDIAIQEMDKWVDTCIFDSTRIATLLNQSSNKHQIIRNGCTTTNLQGTPRFLTISDSQFRGIIFGPFGYGMTESIVATNSHFDTVTPVGAFSIHGGAETPSVESTYQFIDGTFKMLRWMHAQAAGWAVPGQACYFATQSGVTDSPIPIFPTQDSSPVWEIIDQWEDDTYMYVKTTWPYGGYPFPQWGTKGLVIVVHPCKSITFTNCTGGVFHPGLGGDQTYNDIQRLNHASANGHAGKPYGSYFYADINQENIGSDAYWFRMPLTFGRLGEFTVEVKTAYSGANGSQFWRAGGFHNASNAIQSDLTLLNNFGVSVDLRQEGLRTLTAQAATGVVPSESASWNRADLHEWINPRDQRAVPDFVAGDTVQLTFKIIMDQGIHMA